MRRPTAAVAASMAISTVVEDTDADIQKGRKVSAVEGLAIWRPASTADCRGVSSSGWRHSSPTTCCCGQGDRAATGARLRRGSRYHVGVHQMDGRLGGEPAGAAEGDANAGAQEAQGRSDGGRPLCTYDALRAASVDDDGAAAWTTATSQRLAPHMAAACGLDPDEFGGKCWRIGGATNLRNRLGEAGEKVIRERGRWASNVAGV
eukprot:3592924-Pleurochrysis_carterae.AAC.2